MKAPSDLLARQLILFSQHFKAVESDECGKRVFFGETLSQIVNSTFKGFEAAITRSNLVLYLFEEKAIFENLNWMREGLCWAVIEDVDTF